MQLLLRKFAFGKVRSLFGVGRKFFRKLKNQPFTVSSSEGSGREEYQLSYFFKLKCFLVFFSCLSLFHTVYVGPAPQDPPLSKRSYSEMQDQGESSHSFKKQKMSDCEENLPKILCQY